MIQVGCRSTANPLAQTPRGTDFRRPEISNRENPYVSLPNSQSSRKAESQAELASSKQMSEDQFGLVSFLQDEDSSRRQDTQELPRPDDENTRNQFLVETENDDAGPGAAEPGENEFIFAAPSQIEDDSNWRSDAANALTLEQVISSVANCYPEIEVAIGEIETANGKVLASWGEFDQIFSAHSISQPLGFYQNYRNGVGMSRPLFGGGEVYGTYRIGDGDFEPWYGERETNEGGELKAGFSTPLLKNRLIDKRRADLYASGYQRDQVESNVESRLLKYQRFATQAYWDWVASGQAVQVQKKLLQLAEQRVSQIATRIEEGDLAQIAQIDNDRFIAKRKNSLIKARRSLEKAAIKLSLFWRDQGCAPVVVDESRLPTYFPDSFQIGSQQLSADIQTALSVRPELQELVAARKQACIELQYARNLTLPKVDLKGYAGQDIGGETSSKGDKTPFELQLGVLAEVPIQRREGLGKIRAAEGKLSQIDAKSRFVSDKIRAEVQDAVSAVNASHEQILQSKENLRLTRRSLELGQLAFQEGDIDLITLNIYESSVADAALQLLDAQFKYFFSRVIYQTAISARFDSQN